MHTYLPKLVTFIQLRDQLMKAGFIGPISVTLLPGQKNEGREGAQYISIHDVGGQTGAVPSNRVEQ